MKFKFVKAIIAVILAAAVISGCAAPALPAESGRPSVVVTSFPCYDFVRAIAGSSVELSMLLKPGVETHSFEPTPMDIKNVDNSDLFVYVGGDSDEWVDSLLDSTQLSGDRVLTLMSCVDLFEEEIAEGMTEHEHEHEEGEEGEEHEEHEEDEEHEEHGHEEGEVEYDEHVWTSPKNAVRIVERLCEALCAIDSENAEAYKVNAEAYIEKLNALDAEFTEITENAKRREIIVADRFPLLYFAREYGLTYHAAFPGCATDVEASAATIAFLIAALKMTAYPLYST